MTRMVTIRLNDNSYVTRNNVSSSDQGSEKKEGLTKYFQLLTDLTPFFINIKGKSMRQNNVSVEFCKRCSRNPDRLVSVKLSMGTFQLKSIHKIKLNSNKVEYIFGNWAKLNPFRVVENQKSANK